MELLYVLHKTFYLLLYSIIKNWLDSKSRKQSLVITKLRDIPVFIFSHSKASFISISFNRNEKKIDSLLYLCIGYSYEIPDEIEKNDLRRDIMKFFDWFFPENRFIWLMGTTNKTILQNNFIITNRIYYKG